MVKHTVGYLIFRWIFSPIQCDIYSITFFAWMHAHYPLISSVSTPLQFLKEASECKEWKDLVHFCHVPWAWKIKGFYRSIWSQEALGIQCQLPATRACLNEKRYTRTSYIYDIIQWTQKKYLHAEKTIRFQVWQKQVTDQILWSLQLHIYAELRW